MLMNDKQVDHWCVRIAKGQSLAEKVSDLCPPSEPLKSDSLLNPVLCFVLLVFAILISDAD